MSEFPFSSLRQKRANVLNPKGIEHNRDSVSEMDLKGCYPSPNVSTRGAESKPLLYAYNKVINVDPSDQEAVGKEFVK